MPSRGDSAHNDTPSASSSVPTYPSGSSRRQSNAGGGSSSGGGGNSNQQPSPPPIGTNGGPPATRRAKRHRSGSWARHTAPTKRRRTIRTVAMLSPGASPGQVSIVSNRPVIEGGIVIDEDISLASVSYDLLTSGDQPNSSAKSDQEGGLSSQSLTRAVVSNSTLLTIKNSPVKCCFHASVEEPRRYYPLRSRLRMESLKQRQLELHTRPKSFENLPNELFFRVFHYLSIQDLFRTQRVNKRFKCTVERYLLLVKRINFSSGLPFAFLPDSMDDAVLKRVLQHTPEVTHILGFYPRHIADPYPLANGSASAAVASTTAPTPSLTYSGIMAAFRSCTKLRSVEIMDVELMSRIVHSLNRVKFHGMFRNRPDSWDAEYAAPMPAGPPLAATVGGSSSSSPPNQQIQQSYIGVPSSLSGLLAPLPPAPIAQGSPATAQSSPMTLVTPLPPQLDRFILPSSIHNLTKLDLVSVSISALPRLENIKYLHLKWVRFAAHDPFQHFAAPKLQSFVMNNCIGPNRSARYIRILSSLGRATQLNRLELVSTRFVEGIIEHFVDDTTPGQQNRAFRNLQRLVMAGNRECAETDLGLLLVAAQGSLSHVALQISHTRNSLFLALANAEVQFAKLESMVLGYQDPFQSRLTQSEISALNLVDSPDHSMPVCQLTDRGMAAAMLVSPRLTSLSVRHAPFLERPAKWLPAAWPTLFSRLRGHQEQQRGAAQGQQQQVLLHPDHQPHTLTLRSLTLENCPAIRPQYLEEVLNEPNTPMPWVDTVVLRDMFLPLPNESMVRTPRCPTMADRLFPPPGAGPQGTSGHQEGANSGAAGSRVGRKDRSPRPGGRMQQQPFHGQQPGEMGPAVVTGTAQLGAGDMDWRIVERQLRQADQLHAQGSGCPPLGLLISPAQGVASREVLHLNHGVGVRGNEFLRPSEVYAAMRQFRYWSQVKLSGLGGVAMRPDASSSALTAAHSGTQGNVRNSLLTHLVDLDEHTSPSTGRRSSGSSNRHRRTSSSATQASSHARHRRPARREVTDTTGTLAEFHSRPTQTCLCGWLEWHQVLHQQQKPATQTPAGSATEQQQAPPSPAPSSGNCRMVPVSGTCVLCEAPVPTSNCSWDEPVAAHRAEPSLAHRPRVWQARDASVDTSGLRLAQAPVPHTLTIAQDIHQPFANLTTLHMEKVGITHLVLAGAPKLKNLTLENCPELQAVLIDLDSAVARATAQGLGLGLGGSTSLNLGCPLTPGGDVLPALRRIRVVRCPKFAIHHFLHTVTTLYPEHDENLYITFRPFGGYNPLVERALWQNAHNVHVMVSHDYRVGASERNMEDFRSSFDQLFREVLNFSETLIRRDILTIHDQPGVNSFSNGNFMRTEHGSEWDLMTDIPWISEVCCTMLPSDITRTEQADQLYGLLSDIQAAGPGLKLRRRGIHLHVQCRDIHPSSHLPHPYTDAYLAAVQPANLDWNAQHTDPPLTITNRESCVGSSSQSPLLPWQRLLLEQEEEDSEGEISYRQEHHPDHLQPISSRRNRRRCGHQAKADRRRSVAVADATTVGSYTGSRRQKHHRHQDEDRDHQSGHRQAKHHLPHHQRQQNPTCSASTSTSSCSEHSADFPPVRPQDCAAGGVGAGCSLMEVDYDEEEEVDEEEVVDDVVVEVAVDAMDCGPDLEPAAKVEDLLIPVVPGDEEEEEEDSLAPPILM